MTKKAFIIIALLLVVSCASLTEHDRMRLPVQYATLKVIENSGEVTAQGVIRYVDMARGIIDQEAEINTQALVAEILDALTAESLSPADRFLVTALVQQIEIEARSLNLLEQDARLSLIMLLDWIEQAARMAQ